MKRPPCKAVFVKLVLRPSTQTEELKCSKMVTSRTLSVKNFRAVPLLPVSRSRTCWKASA